MKVVVSTSKNVDALAARVSNLEERTLPPADRWGDEDEKEASGVLVPIEELTEALAVLDRARACIIATAEIPMRLETVRFPKTLKAIDRLFHKVGYDGAGAHQEVG